ncbi:MAG: HAD family hydrolase [Oscillospiraceae bacterium]|nr:HAD family hydrolase [Oscillospiraceae bacterium]
MSSHKYKIIAADLDGTLLDKSKNISDRNKKALLEAHRRGVHIVLATGRPPRAASWVFMECGIESGIVLGSGGACVELYPSGEKLYEAVFADSGVMPEVIRYSRERDFFCFGMCGSDYYYERRGPSEDFIINYMKYAGVFGDLLEAGVEFNKSDLLVDESVQEEVLRELGASLEGRAELYLADRGVIDVNPVGVDKGAALIKIAGYLGCKTEDVIAFGDTANDVSMLKTAGLGVCMANGMSEALAAADMRAPSNEESGVGRVIERFVLNG